MTGKPAAAIVGYGKVGRVLARALPAAGYPLQAVVSRTAREMDSGVVSGDSTAVIPPDCGFIILCVRDRLIPELAAELAGGVRREGGVVAHTAGALSAEPLAPVRRIGAAALAWHPLQTFTGDEGPELLQGVTFGIDGDPEAVPLGEAAARDLGGNPFPVPPEMRPLYHLGGVFACNLMAALVGISQDLLQAVGMERDRSLQALAPLLRATAANMADKGLPGAVTGPVKRGDAATIAAHLQVLGRHPEAAAIYRLLSRDLAQRIGGSAAEAVLQALGGSPTG